MNTDSLNDNSLSAYVTNAVANSVVFYAMIYLNHKGLSPIEIRDLRLKYSFENLDRQYFNIDELKKSFVNQSVFFLNLYKEMNENDRFEQFAENLEQQKRFNTVFKNYFDFNALKRQYNRRVFHNNLDCEYMRSDFNEETFHKNTGVFSEREILKDQAYYIVDEVYLQGLKMRLCKICEKFGPNNIVEKLERGIEIVQTSNVYQIISLQTELKIYENDKYIVLTDFEIFRRNLEKWLMENPHLSEDKKLLEIVEEEAKTKAKIDVAALSMEHRLSSRLGYRIADHLENGNCKIYKKTTGEYLKNLEVREYTYLLSLSLGEGGREFLAEGDVLYRVQDWVS